MTVDKNIKTQLLSLLTILKFVFLSFISVTPHLNICYCIFSSQHISFPPHIPQANLPPNQRFGEISISLCYFYGFNFSAGILQMPMKTKDCYALWVTYCEYLERESRHLPSEKGNLHYRVVYDKIHQPSEIICHENSVIKRSPREGITEVYLEEGRVFRWPLKNENNQPWNGSKASSYPERERAKTYRYEDSLKCSWDQLNSRCPLKSYLSKKKHFSTVKRKYHLGNHSLMPEWWFSYSPQEN